MAFDFRYYMEHSNQLTESTLGQLKVILEEYPYFQIARILYLKNLYLLQKADFDYELKKSAPYIYNRPFLHDLLFVQNIPSPNSIIETKPEEEDQPDETIEKNEELKPDNKIEDASAEITSIEEPLKENKNREENLEEKQDTKRSFSDNIKENISGLLDDQLKTAEKETDKLEIIQFQMDIEKEYGKDLDKILKKQETFVLLEEDQEAKIVETTEESEDRKRISASVSYAKDLLEFDYVLKNNIQYKTVNEEEDTENQSEKSFTEWLDSLSNSESKIAETIEEEQQSAENIQEPDRVKIKNQIIDNFIKTNPAIRPEDKPFEFDDISTNSVIEDDNLITDTLARIYYNQGRYDKAIEAYQKLSLKYPEKNSYFATQIEKIQNKLNDLK